MWVWSDLEWQTTQLCGDQLWITRSSWTIWYSFQFLEFGQTNSIFWIEPPLYSCFNLCKWFAGPNGDGVIPNGWIEHSRTTLNAIITFRWIKNAVLSYRWKPGYGLIKVTCYLLVRSLLCILFKFCRRGLFELNVQLTYFCNISDV